MLACWSAKGGVGTTVVAAALAAIAAGARGGALLVDLAGDSGEVCGVPDAAPAEWSAGDGVPLDALRRMATPVGAGLEVVRLGAPHRPPPPASLTTLVGVLRSEPRPVVVDVGTCHPGSSLLTVVEAADDDLLVTRACYLALRRALAVGRRPGGVVLVTEPGRSLGTADVASAIGADVRATVEVDPAVARAVDAGTLVRRMPRTLRRSLAGLR